MSDDYEFIPPSTPEDLEEARLYDKLSRGEKVSSLLGKVGLSSMIIGIAGISWSSFERNIPQGALSLGLVLSGFVLRQLIEKSAIEDSKEKKDILAFFQARFEEDRR